MDLWPGPFAPYKCNSSLLGETRGWICKGQRGPRSGPVSEGLVARIEIIIMKNSCLL